MNTHEANQEVLFHAYRFAHLVDGEVIDAGAIFENDEVWPFLEVRCSDGKTRSVVITCDPAGNGPGWADIVVLTPKLRW